MSAQNKLIEEIMYSALIIMREKNEALPQIHPLQSEIGSHALVLTLMLKFMNPQSLILMRNHLKSQADEIVKEQPPPTKTGSGLVGKLT